MGALGFTITYFKKVVKKKDVKAKKIILLRIALMGLTKFFIFKKIVTHLSADQDIS